MKKKEINQFRSYSVLELEKKVQELRREIAKLQLEFKINQPKDTNILMKKRKQLAVILTLIEEKKFEEKNKL